jgi:hypothetical protein
MDGRMCLDRDFSGFIGLLSAREVRFLVVGVYAVAVHGHPRYTDDLEVWVLVHPDNAEWLVRALDDFGFGSIGSTAADFMQPHRVEVRLDEVVVPFIGLDDLRRNKTASGRPQD